MQRNRKGRCQLQFNRKEHQSRSHHGEKTGIAYRRKKAQLFAASKLAVIPTTMLPYRSYSGDGARSSESKKTSEPI